jgi:hypothetical protein
MGTLLGPVADGCDAVADDFVSDATCNRRGGTVIAVVEVAVDVVAAAVEMDRDVAVG